MAMRAFAVRQLGESPSLHDLPVPPADDAYLIRIVCAGVNPVDDKLLDRLTPESTLPFVMGIDFAGVIERVPAGAARFAAGDRVFGMARRRGAYAEFTAVAPGVATEPLAHIPGNVTDEQAASLPIPGITALRSLDLLEVSAGRSLVVIGANGAVGGYALQMAHARGAHVIAVVRSHPEEARRLGADDVITASTHDIADAIRSSRPDGVDAVLDIVNGSTVIRRDATLVKNGGRLVSTVYAADEGWFAERGITAHNIASISNPLSSPQGLELLAEMVEQGVIAPRVRAVFALDAADKALTMLKAGGVDGKILIRP